MSNITVSRLSVNNFTFRRYSFGYFLQAVKKMGLTNIELSGCHPHFTIFEEEHFDVKKFAKEIKDMGITVTAIEPEQNFLPINIAAADEYLREQSIKQLRFYIENAKEFDCDKVILYPGKAFMNYPHSLAWKNARQSIAKLCEIAAQHGVTILLEGVSNFISDLMMDSTTINRMLKEAGADNLGVCVNTSAAYAAGETLEDYFKRFGNKIKMVQLSDSYDENEQLPWGEGSQDLKQHLDTLRKYCYDGPISMEILEEEQAGYPEESYKKSLEYFAQYADNQ